MNRIAWCSGLFFVLAAMVAPVGAASAQGGFLIQGLADLELWKTDSASFLLARGGGHLAPVVRGDVWAAIEPIKNLVFFGEVSAETGSGRDEPGNEIYPRQYGFRFSPSDELTFEGGKVRQIVGTFSSRQLSFRNPLIGMPDGYATTYPFGARIDGSIHMVDYRVGVVSLPLYRPGYSPDPSAALRPAIGAGLTPTVGMRVGVSATAGPYLNHDLSASQLRGQDWKSYKQRVVAGDAQISRGYFEGNAEVTYSNYDVPGRSTPIDGVSFYLEPKYTFTPRFFMAARYERNDYPFILPVSQTIWAANRVILSDVEIGAGFRATASTLLKLSIRADHWTPNVNPQAPHDNGYAVAAQWSQSFDLVELATRRR
jgi:hypothetical protein